MLDLWLFFGRNGNIILFACDTFAWFTSTDKVTNRLTASANYGVSIVEDFTPPKDMTPGQEVTKTASVVNTGNIDAFVRVALENYLTIKTYGTADVTCTSSPTAVYYNDDLKQWSAANGSGKTQNTGLTAENYAYMAYNGLITEPTISDGKVSSKDLVKLNRTPSVTATSGVLTPDEVTTLQAGGQIVVAASNSLPVPEQVVQSGDYIDTTGLTYGEYNDDGEFLPKATGLYLFRRTVYSGTDNNAKEYSGYYYVAADIAIGTKSATNTGNDSRFNEKNKFDKVVLSPENRYIGAEEFLKNNASTNPLSSIEFKSYPDGTGGVTHIGTSVFNACSQATDFDFPPNVVQINNMAYGWMGGISDLHFPLSLSYLTPKNFTKSDGTRASFGNWAFQYNNIDDFVCGIFTVDRTIFNVLDTNSNPVSGATADIFDIYNGTFGPNTIEFTNLVGTISGNTFKDSGKFNKVKFYILNDAVNVESGAWNSSNGSEAVLIIRGSNLNRIGYNCGFNQSTQTVILSGSDDKATAQSIFGNLVIIKTQAEFKAEHPDVASIRTFVENKSSGATTKSIERVIQVLCDDLEIEYTFNDETGEIIDISTTINQNNAIPSTLFHPIAYLRKEDYLYST